MVYIARVRNPIRARVQLYHIYSHRYYSELDLNFMELDIINVAEI